MLRGEIGMFCYRKTNLIKLLFAPAKSYLNRAEGAISPEAEPRISPSRRLDFTAPQARFRFFGRERDALPYSDNFIIPLYYS